ncbi:hypothetical protein TRAPUB_7967 [Trametes pubescens]|uniref:DUF7770 domain-containing protein n=1 Tax=Trametes pubescens TaxID=154538 RepID=A0A1M2V1V5_TRAPU|nr:hypothetical protein TRAPUB_7967 [Trametes pubescens]
MDTIRYTQDPDLVFDTRYPEVNLRQGAHMYLDEAIAEVYLVCGNDVINDGNHWRIFFVLASASVADGRSIHIDMLKKNPGEPAHREYGEPPIGPDGSLHFVYKKYGVTTARFAFVDLPLSAVAGRVTVRMVLTMVVQKRMQYYRYSPGKNGCRFWMRTLIAELQNQGLLQSPAAMVAADQIINNVYSATGIFQPVEIEEGKFLDPNF